MYSFYEFNQIISKRRPTTIKEAGEYDPEDYRSLLMRITALARSNPDFLQSLDMLVQQLKTIGQGQAGARSTMIQAARGLDTASAARGNVRDIRRGDFASLAPDTPRAA